MASTYDIGDKIRETVTFTNVSGTVTDPTAIKCHVENPAGTVTTYTYAATSGNITRSSTGVYLLDITSTGLGLYEVRWTGTGSLVATVEGWFSVRPRRVTT